MNKNIICLFDENKISFSYILLKYIFKSSIFIYQIKFFIKVRNSLLEIFKSNSDIFSSFKIKKNNQQIIDKLNYILDVMFNSNKYIIKDNNLKKDKSSNKSKEIDTDSNSKNTIK